MGYNGYANYQTWNVVLWIMNDENLYAVAKGCRSYSDFRAILREMFSQVPKPEHCVYQISVGTPDDVRWDDRNIDQNEVEEAIHEITREAYRETTHR